MARTVALLATVATAAASSCDSPFVVGADGVLRDTCGRQRYFRGLNSVWKSFPYYVDPNVFQGGGRSLSPQDRLLWRSLGFNAVRLGVLWEGTVPTARGVINETYLDTMANISAALYKDAGIYTLVDAHQDLFSPLFCADGAPPWAAQEYAQGSSPFPEPVAPNGTGCGLPSWAEYYPTAAVSRAFQTLYTTETGMTDYGDFWTAVVAAYARNPTANAGILGLELINEPWAGDIYADPLLLLPGVADKANLQPFYFNISARIRAAETSAGVPHRVIYSEPVTWDNFVNAGFDALPGASEGLSGLSYHFYPLPDVVGALWQVEARANDSHRLGAVGFLTEFDVNLVAPVSLPYTELDLRATLDACDDVGHGYLGVRGGNCARTRGARTSCHSHTLSLSPFFFPSPLLSSCPLLLFPFP
jgi:endoglycosylceramidase